MKTRTATLLVAILAMGSMARADITQHVWKFPTLSPYDLNGNLMTNPKNWKTSILPDKYQEGEIWVDREGHFLKNTPKFVTKPATTAD
jgi:hypothetical protein